MRPLLLAALAATPAQAATHAFCWQGEAGYRIEGTISLPDGARGILTEVDLTDFRIRGFRDAEPLGTWRLGNGPGPVVIRFDADRLLFPTGGDPALGTYQAWNAGGTVDDCGDPGFGFNGGNLAQDVCVDGTFAEESGIPPATPLRIAPDPSNPCGPVLMGRAVP
ncbi:hypothetical protein [Jannaschia sp. W003]|uniref:hypothetical protein n=1 Tax=Jannaschia sp. W003 TaxID=2867012 RepID=UPI0021A2D596|nr:hypothetical protein [Jannaschia sp. W003]UWQ21894.1 hypothetical protein K3554_02365 [Jannaschia sp. W003]